MDPKCSCGADSSDFTNKKQTIGKCYTQIIFCKHCGKIHGVLPDYTLHDIEKVVKKY